MPRTSRKNLKSKYFHVISQGIEKKYIFEKKIYKERYLDLIFKQSEEFKIKIIAYCVMENHVHLLINIEEIDNMSKFMHKVNFMYAQYYNFMENNRVGYVFRNRFMSEPIYDEKYLLNCIRYIHNNPVKAKMVQYPYQYKYSSYNKFINKNDICELLDTNKIINSNVLEDYIFIDIEHDIEEIIENVIKKYEKKYEMSFEEMKKRSNRNILAKILEELKENYKVTYREISNKTKVSLSTISRLINKK